MSHWVERIPWPLGREMLKLMRVDRPIGTWLLMWPSLWALTAASQGRPDPWLLVIFAVGAFVMRSAGCVANDLADRNIDPHVARTKERPLAAGRIGVAPALGLLIFLLAIALTIALTLPATALLYCVAGAWLAVSYPFTKRYISFPQFYMGAAFGWGVIIAWATVTASVPLEAWLIFAATLCWAAGYDTIYAMMDRPDDLKIGVHSTAILFGRYDVVATGILYLLTLLLLAWVGVRLHLSWFYFGGLLITAGHMVWQLHRCQGYQTDRLLHAFLANRWIGLGIWLCFLVG
ncbi:MAG: 4-hydroxybenzoate octaprenyltransferase [Magnetococcales bacterium]|nr:4-hydroxybenzoate octaprenyltransferase [Magnetococcales bacterium]NGZ25324.1 4-hydroxybenzoate octaprenyltransferase [Magnetococcales bacterium]